MGGIQAGPESGSAEKDQQANCLRTRAFFLRPVSGSPQELI